MKHNKKHIVSRYLPIAFVTMLLMPMANISLATGPQFNLSTPPVPDGMAISSSQGEINSPELYGFTEPNGFDDGVQWRQSLLLCVRPCYNTSVNRLNGYTIDFVIYCPVLPQAHTMSVLGDVVYLFDDGRTVTHRGGFVVTWTTHDLQMPLLMLFELSARWMSLTCKNIYVSFDYCEDGQLIRHIERSWINLPRGKYDSVPAIPVLVDPVSIDLMSQGMASQVVD